MSTTLHYNRQNIFFVEKISHLLKKNAIHSTLICLGNTWSFGHYSPENLLAGKNQLFEMAIHQVMAIVGELYCFRLADGWPVR